MDKKTIQTGEEKIESSSDALVIADAIYGGLYEIAKAIRSMNQDSGSDYGEPEQIEMYLDGTKM